MPIRRPLLLLAALLLGAVPARADDRVQRIPDADLPVAATCAPIRGTDVTYVTVSPRTQLQWFGVSGERQPIEYESLVALLKRRAGAAKPSRHAVWITASARHAWVHAMRVRQACALAGIYRVGLRVRSEATGQALGFPLFLSAAGSAAGTRVRAGRLDIRITTLGEREAKAASDVGHLYAAARRAMERRTQFGVQKIVANLWIATNTPLQYAVTAIDLLYRSGCSGVRLRSGVRLPRLEFNAIPVVEIQKAVVSRLPQALRPPPLAPRSEPWPIDGAAEAGWVDYELVDLPAIGKDGAARAPAGPKPEPNYAEAGRGVPEEVVARVDRRARTWAQRLGADILAGLRGGPELESRLAVGLRRKEVMPDLIGPARQAFPDATRVQPSALQFSAFLFHRGKIQGRADVTVNLAGRRLALVFGRWVRLDPSQPITLDPFPVDPFAAGDPAAFRIWLEGVFDAARREGAAGLPMATPGEVLPFLPAVAHPGTRAALDRRAGDVAALAAELARTPYDRVVLAVQRGTATVIRGNAVIGILSLGLRAEENELRLDELKPRRAR